MPRLARSLSLALTFALGAVIGLIGILRGAGPLELAGSTAVSMVIFFLLVRAVTLRISTVVVNILADERAERERRRLLTR